MTMTPQQLMDLPHAGMAERQLRKDGRWELTPMERMVARIEKALRVTKKDLNT